RDEMVPALVAAIAHLPADRPRYLMGVGDPASVIEAVAAGVDQFDCVMQTRIGRHGTALTATGKLHIKNAKHALSDEPLDADCTCDVCRRHSRGYIRHLFQVGEPTASRLVSLHNVSWTLQLMERIRSEVRNGTFDSFRVRMLAVWG
ncbi:MAG TPA: tRNA guanosine(34) transglycosylase Tgt, partial [Ilumatobacteraceae bacterium]